MIIKLTHLLMIVALCCSAAVAQVISPKEMLNISIKGVGGPEQAKVAGSYVVSPNGHIYLPMIKGGIRASGKTSSALARSIEAAYRAAEIYKSPRITVVSTKDNAEAQIDAKLITVGGFVKQPGSKPYTRGMTLFNAVSAAGGETAFGSIRRVELHRNGKKWIYDLRKGEHMGVKVYPGDTINVPQKKWDGS